MNRDLRTLFKNDQELTNAKMPEGHQARFLEQLETALPEHSKPKFNWLNVAASIVIVLGTSFGVFKMISGTEESEIVAVENTTIKVATAQEKKTLKDVSPDLKKVEDYYVANINLELSKMKITPENKEMFDGYIAKLEELNLEYNRLSLELTNNGPDELTVNALINNLKLRLNLMYRLKEQLKRMNTLEASQT